MVYGSTTALEEQTPSKEVSIQKSYNGLAHSMPAQEPAVIPPDLGNRIKLFKAAEHKLSNVILGLRILTKSEQLALQQIPSHVRNFHSSLLDRAVLEAPLASAGPVRILPRTMTIQTDTEDFSVIIPIHTINFGNTSTGNKRYKVRPNARKTTKVCPM
ncbi:hypothetical protein EC973_006432 [Apophysomyces ossiformis]|uniref:Uncharacterized protein n=1 Tax=Apophysomyces ossiformis TaxID=679940 RepID=A0A8H7ESC3_9FUNG|nr:hypothetical protein EC973_006432 [Apophysomyces ossiformis]